MPSEGPDGARIVNVEHAAMHAERHFELVHADALPAQHIEEAAERRRRKQPRQERLVRHLEIAHHDGAGIIDRRLAGRALLRRRRQLSRSCRARRRGCWSKPNNPLMSVPASVEVKLHLAHAIAVARLALRSRVLAHRAAHARSFAACRPRRSHRAQTARCVMPSRITIRSSRARDMERRGGGLGAVLRLIAGLLVNSWRPSPVPSAEWPVMERLKPGSRRVGHLQREIVGGTGMHVRQRNMFAARRPRRRSPSPWPTARPRPSSSTSPDSSVAGFVELRVHLARWRQRRRPSIIDEIERERGGREVHRHLAPDGSCRDGPVSVAVDADRPAR